MAPTLDILQHRLRTLIPAQYQQTPATPVSMGSAGLQYNADGTVAWDQIWGRFCDLALAGGPPHKGSLLQPASAANIASNPIRYQQVVREICRGITLVTELDTEPDTPGWVRISCSSNTMAGWLLRAITTENIAVRAEGSTLYLPAGPDYRLDKQIKNVITVIAKTTHYWRDHMPASQQWAIADLFAVMQAEAPLLQPDLSTTSDHYHRIANSLQQQTPSRYPGWIGIPFPTPQTAIDTMRLSIANNVLARREDSTLFLPLNPTTDPDGSRLLAMMT
jgi:sirohydrochlorin cobaltochelatase